MMNEDFCSLYSAVNSKPLGSQSLSQVDMTTSSSDLGVNSLDDENIGVYTFVVYIYIQWYIYISENVHE